LELKDSEVTRKVWPHSFILRLTTTIVYEDVTKSRLHQKLTVINENENEKFDFTTALHTYFSISNIHTTTVSPCMGITFLDKPSNQRLIQEEDTVTFKAETDKVFYNAPDRLVIEDSSVKTKILLEKNNFPEAVIWNIWSEKIKGMSDMSPEEWENYVCVEPGAIGIPIVLAPKQVWEATQHFSLKIDSHIPVEIPLDICQVGQEIPPENEQEMQENKGKGTSKSSSTGDNFKEYEENFAVEKQYDDLAIRMRDPQNGVEVKDRKWYFRNYKECFVGRELVDWMLKENLANTREKAIQIGRELQKRNYLSHVTRGIFRLL